MFGHQSTICDGIPVALTDRRYLTSGATACSRPNVVRLRPQEQQRAIASARWRRSASSCCRKKHQSAQQLGLGFRHKRVGNLTGQVNR